MDNFIEIYKNVFDTNFCDKVIKYFQQADELGFTLNRQDHDKASKLNKDDLAMFIPEITLNHSSAEIVNTFNNLFWENCYKKYAAKYSSLDEFEQHRLYTLKVQKTEPGQGYHLWHAEASGRAVSNRILAWTVYLNDNFEAGETEFLYQQYRYKPSKGDVVIFPAGFTHTHRGNPPIGGDKYIITGWVEF